VHLQGAFVFHFKGYTLFSAKGEDRDALGEKNYTAEYV